MEGAGDDFDGGVSFWRRLWKSVAPWETSWAQLPGEYSCKGKPRGYSIDLSHADSGGESEGGGDSRGTEREEEEMEMEKGASRSK